jgi:hypothetical protein
VKLAPNTSTVNGSTGGISGSEPTSLTTPLKRPSIWSCISTVCVSRSVQLLGLSLLLVACSQTPPPVVNPLPVIKLQTQAKPTFDGPRIEWPSAYAQQVHFPLYLDDDLPVCVQVGISDRSNSSDVLCQPLSVLRWQLLTRRSTE